jgi:nucleoside-diphosphate-sugar epimerase
MRVLITGSDGYIGHVLAPAVQEAGHEVVGLDTGWFQGCALGPESVTWETQRLDIRDVTGDHLRGFHAIVHLAAISNDPLGHLDPKLTSEINHLGSVWLARSAKRAGVARFVFASSCSLYGAASRDDVLTESAPLNPVSPYGESKILAEREVSMLADDDFSPIFLRNATAYGYSPRLRLDLVANDLAANALTTNEVLIRSDGTPWRPVVHVQDIASAAIAALNAPRASIHNERFNIGRRSENYQVHEIADLVVDAVPGSHVTYAAGGGPDRRSYRVDFSKAETKLPGFEPRWSLREGIHELVEAYRRFGLISDDLSSPRFIRLQRIQDLLQAGSLGPQLRWTSSDTPAIATS